jgi:hypothetical protein
LGQVSELATFLQEHIEEVLSFLDNKVLSLSRQDLARNRRNIKSRISCHKARAELLEVAVSAEALD